MNSYTMGRDAFLIYLKDIYDLETMKVLLNQKVNEGNSKVRQIKREYLTENKIEPDRGRKNNAVLYFILTYLIIAVSIPLVGGVIYGVILAFFGDFQELIEVLAATLPILIAIIVLAVVINKRRRENKAAVDKNKKHNKEDDERIRNNREFIYNEYEKPWEVQRNKICQIYAGACNALNKNYALNIIPRQYRNLAAIKFIYDFMSTSHLSFEQAVNQAQIDNGIRRIEKRLDIIIRQNESQLKELYSIRQNTETIIEQQNKILMAQIATAYYARQCALHTESIRCVVEGLYV
ncbi:MAG: hypothetical protein LUF33_02840 [Clostridiales bacterium]|nr:hypothetical protein [Clostridiales bacterium]